jgi:F-type H+-transporting ATPase subunit b
VLDFGVTFFITLINVTFLFLVLRKILFKPVTKFMADRTEKIKREIETAKNMTARASALEKQFEEKMQHAREEGQKIIQTAREKAEAESAAIIAKAREDAERIVSDTRRSLADERSAAERELREETAELTISAASRVIAANLDTEKNRALVKQFIDAVGVA